MVELCSVWKEGKCFSAIATGIEPTSQAPRLISALCLSSEHRYQLQAICDCAESCVRALLNQAASSDGTPGGQSTKATDAKPIDQLDENELEREPNQSASEILLEVSSLACEYFRDFAKQQLCLTARN